VILEAVVDGRVGEFHLQVRFRAGGGVTALFGPSGAGKTLTLRHIAGLNRPEEGRITLGDRTLFDSERGIHLQPQERAVGYVSQESVLFPHLSVAGNVGFGLHREPRSRRNRRIAEVLELVELAGYESRSPDTLSGGEGRRIAMARALAPRPSILLLDEPFAGLDFRVRRTLRRRLLAIHENTGVPILLVTHSLADVREVCDELVLVDRGRTVAAGSAGELMASPPSPHAAELLAEDMA